MKILLMIAILSSISLQAQVRERVLTDDISGGGGRLLSDDISGGGGRIVGGIELLNLKRISGTTKYELKDARPTIKRFIERSGRADLAIKMMDLKIMADFKDIAEITLKDGTVLKAEELLK
ncbi:MAG: hypothetical protein KC478_12230 [Bacteriovoracaceae bacterium]|nr:hypothetical protein [Bacteriovoracaceae bacterium]